MCSLVIDYSMSQFCVAASTSDLPYWTPVRSAAFLPNPSVGLLSTQPVPNPRGVAPDARYANVGSPVITPSDAKTHWPAASRQRDAFSLRVVVGRATVRSAHRVLTTYSHALMVLLSAPSVWRRPSASSTPPPDDRCYKRGDA